MNLFDILIIIILLYCLVRGIFRGLLKEMSSLAGVLGGFYAAYTYYREVGKLLNRWIADPNYVNILSFLLVFICVFLIISILGIIIKYILKIVFLGLVDRVFGAVFGILKGILIASVLLIVFTAFLPDSSNIIKTSKTSHYLAGISNKMIKVTPKDLKREYQKKIKDIEKVWEKIN
ncbi:MAG: CvpA family protein [Proteobacteria bacterium]|nr:CvpA family protein [Pseudomonadota bacterium]